MTAHRSVRWTPSSYILLCGLSTCYDTAIVQCSRCAAVRYAKHQAEHAHFCWEAV